MERNVIRSKISVQNPGKQAVIGKCLAAVGAYILMAAFMKWPQTVSAAAQRAMEQWYHSVAPALFPFMMLMPLITSKEASDIYEKMLGGIMNGVFALPGSAAPALITGLAAGSPAGAAAAGQAAANAGMGKGQLTRLVGCMCGLSPAFLVNAVGTGMMGDTQAGMILLETQIITQLLMLFFTRWGKRGDDVQAVQSDGSPGASTAVMSVLNVAGYMVFFSILSAVLNEIAGEKMGRYVLCVLEVTAGAGVVSGSGLVYREKMAVLAAVCGFGGICICAQNVKILAKYGIKPLDFIPWRIAGAGVSVIVMMVLTHEKPLSTPVFQLKWLNFMSIGAVFLAFPALIGLKKHIS